MDKPRKLGRPPAPGGALLQEFKLRLTAELKEKLIKLGGSAWVRKKIEQAKDPGKFG
jgi:hypothetical protein